MGNIDCDLKLSFCNCVFSPWGRKGYQQHINYIIMLGHFIFYLHVFYEKHNYHYYNPHQRKVSMKCNCSLYWQQFLLWRKPYVSVVLWGNLKALRFFSPVSHPREALSQPFPSVTLWYLSQTQFLLRAVGAFQGEQPTHENRVSTISQVLNTTESIGNSRAAPPVSK